MTKARPGLTEIVDKARDRGIATALTEYGRPRAFVVSVPFFERAERDAALLAKIREIHPELLDELSAGAEAVSVPMKLSEAA